MRRLKIGESQPAIFSTNPACSAIFRKPSQSVSVPKSKTITSTDNFAMEKILSTMRANTSGSFTPIHRHNALTKATKKKLTHSVFNMDPLRFCMLFFLEDRLSFIMNHLIRLSRLKKRRMKIIRLRNLFLKTNSSF